MPRYALVLVPPSADGTRDVKSQYKRHGNQICVHLTGQRRFLEKLKKNTAEEKSRRTNTIMFSDNTRIVLLEPLHSLCGSWHYYSVCKTQRKVTGRKQYQIGLEQFVNATLPPANIGSVTYWITNSTLYRYLYSPNDITINYIIFFIGILVTYILLGNFYINNLTYNLNWFYGFDNNANLISGVARIQPIEGVMALVPLPLP